MLGRLRLHLAHELHPSLILLDLHLLEPRRRRGARGVRELLEVVDKYMADSEK